MLSAQTFFARAFSKHVTRMIDPCDTSGLEAVAWQVHKECQQALSNLRRQDARGSKPLHRRVGTDVYLQAALIAIISDNTRTGMRFVQWHCTH